MREQGWGAGETSEKAEQGPKDRPHASQTKEMGRERTPRRRLEEWREKSGRPGEAASKAKGFRGGGAKVMCRGRGSGKIKTHKVPPD